MTLAFARLSIASSLHPSTGDAGAGTGWMWRGMRIPRAMSTPTARKSGIPCYSYRDYVIRAFNRDLPYDQFLLEQIAADCLPGEPGHDRSRLAALGFLTLGRRFVNNIHDIIDDRLDVIFRGTQGLTIGCARCHDHKYDPIPTRDYYSLYGVLASTTERTVRLDDSTPDNPARRLYASELDARQKALDGALEARRAELSRRLRDRVEEYLVAVPEADKLPGDEFYVILRDPNDLNPVFVHRWKSYLLRTQTGGESHPIFGPWHAFAALGEKDFASRAPCACSSVRSRCRDRWLSDNSIVRWRRRSRVLRRGRCARSPGATRRCCSKCTSAGLTASTGRRRPAPLYRRSCPTPMPRRSARSCTLRIRRPPFLR